MENFPPGVTDSMIPGNTPEDQEWERFYEKADKDCEEMGLYPDQANAIWEIGKAAWKAYRNNYDE